MAADKDDGHKRIAENRKARFDYLIEDTCEAGIELTGTEVKSLRAGQANIAESYASAEKGGIFLVNAYIPEYKQAGDFFQHDPRRPRRLLLHKTEIHKLAIAVDRQGMTMVPLELYFNAQGPGQAEAGPGPGQEAARQARGHRQARLAAPEGAAVAGEGVRRFLSPFLRGEGQGEGQRLAPAPVAAPHPDPLPTEEWGEGGQPRFDQTGGCPSRAGCR